MLVFLLSKFYQEIVDEKGQDIGRVSKYMNFVYEKFKVVLREKKSN